VVQLSFFQWLETVESGGRSFSKRVLENGERFKLAEMYFNRYLSRMVRQVIFYETAGGACPVAKFLRKLSTTAQDEILASIQDVQEQERPPSDLFCKMINTGGLWEIRAKLRGDIFRLLCFLDGSALIVAAHGFQKKTQKTPRQDIQTAEKRKNDYFRRKNHG
jgi:phage-related protein